MYGYNILSDGYISIEAQGRPFGTIHCSSSEIFTDNCDYSKAIFVGANRYGSVKSYLTNNGKLISVNDMGQFHIIGRDIKYNITSNSFSLEAIHATIGTHIVGQILLNKSYLLHAATLSRNEYAVSIIGTSGAGKSTIAIELMRKRNYKLVSEDMTALYKFNGKYYAGVGMPYIKMWMDTYNALHIYDWAELSYSSPKNVYKKDKKLIITVDNSLMADEFTALKAILIINRTSCDNNTNDYCSVEKIKQANGLVTLYNNNYVKYACTNYERLLQVSMAADIINNIPIYSLTYRDGYEHLDDALDNIEKVLSDT